MLKQKTAAVIRSTNPGKFLIPAGVILIVFSIFIFYIVSNSNGYIETDAVVTKTELYENPALTELAGDEEENAETIADIFDVFGNERDKTKTVYVKYTVDGIEYEGVYGVFVGYKEGDQIKVCYDPEDPRTLVQPGNLLHPTVILCVGIAAIVAGILCLRLLFKEQSA